MDDKVKIRCPGCTRIFRERANRVRDGLQVNCVNCSKQITFTRDTEDPFLRKALKSARDVRSAKDAEAAQIYTTSASKRETTF